MLIVTLQILFLVGLIIGWMDGSERLKNSKILFKDRSLLQYFLGR